MTTVTDQQDERSPDTAPFRDTIHERNTVDFAQDRITEWRDTDLRTVTGGGLVALATLLASDVEALLGVVENLQAIADHAEAAR